MIVTWHGKQALTKSLPALVRALRKHGGNHEIVVVVDFESRDGTVEYIRANFPDIRTILSDRSLYFGAATRLGVDNASRDIVVLINNDVIVEEDFLAPLTRGFLDAEVFGVASRVGESSTSGGETGKTIASFHSGTVVWKHSTITQEDEGRQFCPVSWLHRGVFAVDRRKYQWMGGFDDLYDPIYFEDADLSYRAWKIGWKCLLAVNSKVAHEHRPQTPAAGREFIQTIVGRNSYIFCWKNLSNIPLLVRYCWGASWRRVRRARRTSIAIEFQAFAGALKRLPRIIKRRVIIALTSIREDSQVLGKAIATYDTAKVPVEVTGEVR